MNNQAAYNLWAEQYDTNHNLTRDLEGHALRKTLHSISFSKVLEVGCGTGKNSEWIVTRAQQVIAVDFSEEMLKKAKSKIAADHIDFIRADITKAWTFTNDQFDLITFSLVLEHIENLDFIFTQVKEKIKPGGYVYIGELHPFKQYSGSLARFDTNTGRIELECFVHHISQFVTTASNDGFSLVNLNEWFDDETDKTTIPRVISLVFRKG